MSLSKSRSISLTAFALLGLIALTLLTPRQAQAIPAFARKYNVRCYTCHMIPPALNKTGYTFKRLGYRFPPDEMDLTKPAPKITELDKDIKWQLQNSVALITQGSLTYDKVTGDTPSSGSSFNLDEVALFLAASLPETGFSYYAHAELSQDGSSTSMEQAMVDYTAGRANSSYFVRAGMMHMQEGEGTRGGMFYNLFSDPSIVLSDISPVNFTLDQHPVGVAAGYTWASPYFKRVFGVTAKVTNGLNADGSEILTGSSAAAPKNGKDVYLDADYWFGPEGGISAMTYYGSKAQIQNFGAANQFTYDATVRRYGVFANYLFFDKLDVLGGYLRSNDDWEDPAAGQAGPVSALTANAGRGEVDYYIKTGTALMARYDYIKRSLHGSTFGTSKAFAVGAEHALTERGNVVARAAYTREKDTNWLSSGGAITLPGVDNHFMLDIRLMW
jgi:hypothetical protein